MYSSNSLVQSCSKERYLEKLKIIGMVECPYTIAAEFWEKNSTQWPDLEYPEVYQYLIETPGVFTTEAMANRKSLDAYNLFIKSRFVRFFIVV